MTTDDGKSITIDMPTVSPAEYIKNHQSATQVYDAHPIDESIIESASETFSVEFSLAAIQAIADMYIDDFENATLVESTSKADYYCVTSDVFYQLAAQMADEFSNSYIEIEQLREIVDAHTTQYAVDLHGYRGDFEGREITLCNALNDSTPQHGVICHETEPESAHYGFVDSRGLVVQRGTHTEE